MMNFNKFCILAESTSFIMMQQAEPGSNISLDLQTGCRRSENLHADNILFHKQSSLNSTKQQN